MLDTLDDFQPETELTSKGTSLKPSSRPSTVALSIADVLAASVEIDWFEAIAVSQSLCASLRDSGDDQASVRVDAGRVLLTPSGEVELVAARIGRGTALDEVSALLRTMLEDRAIPTPLRLAVSEAALSGSLSEWAGKIAYFERPNRSAIVRALYDRATDRMGTTPPQALETEQARTALPVSTPEVPRRRRRAPFQVRRLMVGGMVALLIAAAVSVSVMAIREILWSDPVPRRETLAAEQRTGTTGAPGPTRSLIGEISSRIPFIGNPKIATADADPAPPKGQWIRLYPRDRAPEPELTTEEMQIVSSVSVGPRSVAAAPRSASPAVLPPARDIIYSLADPDVTPPTSIYPRFPRTPPPIDPNEFAEFEVIVTETGGVESVKARRVPENMAEMVRVTMSLSAMKAWRFQPGLKDGDPVKFRHVVWVQKN